MGSFFYGLTAGRDDTTGGKVRFQASVFFNH
ncbi:hypothetical protein J2X69_002146 [Algoriphagus sp. 4150]|nr:hypothetical protein [Algoriphagus sp. 4150]